MAIRSTSAGSVQRKPPRRICGDCGREFRAWKAGAPCPHCDSDVHRENRQTLAEWAREARLQRARERELPQ
jgi:predicted amidophosphoribosyltransferase